MNNIRKYISKSTLMMLELQAICVLCTGAGLNKDVIKVMQKVSPLLHFVTLNDIGRDNADYIGERCLLN
tara:strand:+ start:101 stop:307 length:207 start_codon:yes stop_codon:yes gene_type:complete